MDLKAIAKVGFGGYNKIRKFATGNSLHDLTENKEFSVMKAIKEKLWLYVFVVVVCLFVSWKLTIAIVATIIFASLFKTMVSSAKIAALEAEEEVLKEKSEIHE